MDDAVLHFDYATERFASALDKHKSVAPAQRDGLVSQVVLAFEDYVRAVDSDGGFAKHYARAAVWLRLVVSQMVAYTVTQFGQQGWQAAFTEEHFNGLLQGLYPDPQAASLQRTTIWHMAQWVVEGRRVFAPAEGLCKRLERLDLRGVTGHDIALPFRSFYVLVPYGIGLPMPDLNGNTFALRGLYVCEDHYDGDVARAGRVAHILAIGQWRLIGNTGHHDDQLFYWTIPLHEGADALRISQERVALSWRKFSGSDDKTLRALWDLNLWVWHLLAYLSDAEIRRDTRYLDPEVAKLQERLRKHPKGRKRDRVKDELKKRSQQRVIVIGADVKAPSQSRGKGTPLEVRQLVRGHRKRQPFGPRRQDRKEITIAPYWRGPEDGEQSGSRFMLR